MTYISVDTATGAWTTISQAVTPGGALIMYDRSNNIVGYETGTNNFTAYTYDGTATLAVETTDTTVFQNSHRSLFWDIHNPGYVYAGGEGPFGDGVSIFLYDPLASPAMVRQVVQTWAADDLGIIMDFRDPANVAPPETGDRFVAWPYSATQTARAFTVSGTTVTDTGSVDPATVGGGYAAIAWDKDTGKICIRGGEICVLNVNNGTLSSNGLVSITYQNITTEYSRGMVNQDIMAAVGTSGTALWIETFDVSSGTSYVAADAVNLTTEGVGNQSASVFPHTFFPGYAVVTNGSGSDAALIRVDEAGVITVIGVEGTTGQSLASAGGYLTMMWLESPL